MKTKIFDFSDQSKYDNGEIEDLLEEPVEMIQRGDLVAIPTETVYGLGADGLNGLALQKIFQAKNRPMDNPLILHIADVEDIYRLSKNIKKEDLDKVGKLWPGPLTIIVEKSEIIPEEVSAGLDSVAIRMPNKEITRDFIRLCACPLAAPSANLSSKPSPTSAKSVLEDMDGKIAGVIDGGSCEIGIESTVLDLTEDCPKILRPGYYTKEMLEEYWDHVEMDLSLKDKKAAPKAPGQKYKHYAPKAEVLVIIGEDDPFQMEVEKVISENSDKKIGLMLFDSDKIQYNIKDIITMGDKDDLSYMGQLLFDSLRRMDENGVELIIVRGVEEEGYGLSIMNRLKKAASHNIRRV